MNLFAKKNNELSIYSINPINNENSGNQKRFANAKQLDTANNSIAYIQDLFKSKLVKKYNNDYKNSLKESAKTDVQSAKKGFWFTDSIKTAQSYAEYSNEYSGLNGLLCQQKIAETKRDWEEYDRLTEEIENYYPDAQNQTIMPVYLHITNPKTFDAQNHTFMEIQNELNEFLSDIENYDGVIISNLKDATSNVEDESATHYMVKNSEQIKSVNNRGTFDADNPNFIFRV